MTPPRKTLHDIDPVTSWAEDVAAEKIVAGPHVRDAAERHLKDMEHGAERGLIWDVDEARRRIDLFPKHFRLRGGAFEGRPFHLHPSQAFRVGSLYGWRLENGERRFRKFYDEEGKGNGKSPLLAGLGLQGLCFDNKSRAEIYAAASKKEIAMVLFEDAVTMCALSPTLSARVRALGKDPAYKLVYQGRRKDKRFFRPMSSDVKQSGPRPYIVLLDEIHEHKNRTTFDMSDRGLAKSPVNSLLAMATNSGHDRNSFCYEQHAYACLVAKGDIDWTDENQVHASDRFFSFVCGLDAADDWMTDPSCWQKSNPLLGVTIQNDDLAAAVADARAIPGKKNEIARLHFCEWTEAHTVWIPREQLTACADREFDLDAMGGRRCWGGVDLSIRRDMTARALVFEDGTTADGRPCFALWAHGYLPGGVIADREREDQAPYRQWTEEGFITACGQTHIDYGHVAENLVSDAARFDIEYIAMDMHLGDFLLDALGELGADDLPLVTHPQGTFKGKKTPLFMPHSIALFEQLVAEHRLRIAFNPALWSALASVSFYKSAGGLRRFDKTKSTARIDLALAATMAVGAALSNYEKEETSFWMAKAS